MARRDWTYLFTELDLSAVLDHQRKKVAEAVMQIGKPSFELQSDEFLAALVASEQVIEAIEIDESEITVSSRETKVDVSRDFARAVMDRSQPAYVNGVEVTYHLPFRGDRVLLKCRPNTYTMNPPRAVVGNKELQYPYPVPGADVSSTKQSFERELSELRQWVGWVNDQVREYNGALEGIARQQIARRRADLATAAASLNSLGFKVREEATKAAPSSAATVPPKKRRAANRAKAQRTFDVALSFAGEDRSYVERVATHLKDQLGLEVFYDDFEKVELWGKDLSAHLGEVYGKHSRFVVLFLSRHYAAKAWPNFERQVAVGRALAGDSERVLPVRFDDTTIPGFSPTISYIDLRALTPEKLAELIRQKVDTDER